MSDRDDLAAIVASLRGVTARVNDNDRWVADAILDAGWRASLVHYPRPHSSECGLCGMPWPCEGAFKSVDCPIHGHESRFGAAVDDVHVEQPIRTWGGHIISALPRNESSQDGPLALGAS